MTMTNQYHNATAAGNSQPIMPLLKSGGVLKFSRRTDRFFVVQHSREIPVSQSEARRLATSLAMRPNGVDSHGQFVFALNQARPGDPSGGSKP